MDELFQEQQTMSDPAVNYREQLVGDGKKFKTDEELARGKYEADQTIEVMKQKLDELRSELKNKNSMEAMLEKLREVGKPSEVNPQSVATPAATPAVDLEAKLEELLKVREAKHLQESNIDKSKRVLIENFGDRANEVLNRKAQELSMPLSELQALAARSPSAFLQLVGAQENRQVPQAGVAMGRTHSPSQDPGRVVRNQAFYEKMKRENPTLYFDGKTTSQQIKDAMELGDAYYS